jgi:hypothetical protein
VQINELQREYGQLKSTLHNRAVEDGLANPLRSLANLLTATFDGKRNNQERDERKNGQK